MSAVVPYVIIEEVGYFGYIDPDSGISSVNTVMDSIEEQEMDTFFIECFARFIIKYGDIEDIESLKMETIQDFRENYSNPWIAKAFINRKWINVTPTDEEVFEYIKNNKNVLEEEKEEVEVEEEDYEEDEVEEDEVEEEDYEARMVSILCIS